MRIELYINRDYVTGELGDLASVKFPAHLVDLVNTKFPGHEVHFEWSDSPSHGSLPPVCMLMGYTLRRIITESLAEVKKELINDDEPS